MSTYSAHFRVWPVTRRRATWSTTRSSERGRGRPDIIHRLQQTQAGDLAVR